VIEHDELIERLREERPAPPVWDPAEADALLDRILALPLPRQAGSKPGRTRRIARYAAAPVAAAALIAGLIAVSLPDTSPRTEPRQAAGPAKPVAVDMQRIAATSAAALHSGKARVDIVSGIGSPMEQRISGLVLFSGDDLEMQLHFGPVAGRGDGFDAENRTVGGEFYLLDGPPNAKRWYHDTNAGGGKGTDLFTADPRSLLATLGPVAGFTVVDTADGLRHLRATRLDQLPSLNLTMGPIDPREIELLDVWVGADDVVRKLETRLLHIERTESGPLLVKDGKGRVVRQVVPVDANQATTTETRTSYAIEFTEYGSPVEITPPAHAVDTAGKG
jgi:hypothetical protein